jgi:predicted secreted protein
MRMRSRPKILFGVAALAFAISLVACAQQTSKTPAAPAPPTPAAGGPAANGDLPAPMPYEAMKAIEKSDAGKTIEVPVGATFVVQLVGVPTAGYLWKPVDPPAFLEPGAVTGGPTTKAQLQPGFAGGNHWEVFAFKAKGTGKATLRLEQRRPWETNEPPADVFEVTIKVTEAK